VNTPLYVDAVLPGLLRERGMTYVDLARQIHIDPSVVSLWAKGKRPVPVPRIAALAVALGVGFAELRFEPQPAEPEPPPWWGGDVEGLERFEERIRHGRLFGAGMTSERGPRDVIGVCLQCGENYPIEDRRLRLRRCGRCHGQVLVEAA
jgi:transcriptional regulator with XRE-family HTH domain